MKKAPYNMVLLTLLFCANSCILPGKRVTGNGEMTSEQRQAGAFEELIVAGSMHVYLTQGPVQPARIVAESNILPYIELNNHDDKLEIRFKNNTSIVTHQPVEVHLTAPHVNDLSMVGSGSIKVQDTLNNEDEIKLHIAGSGNIRLQVNTPETDADIAGSGDIVIVGEARDLEINLLGSGNFKGENLKSEQTDVKIAGSGNAWVSASIRLKAKILGSGSVHYRGDPAVETHKAGSGTVIRQE